MAKGRGGGGGGREGRFQFRMRLPDLYTMYESVKFHRTSFNQPETELPVLTTRTVWHKQTKATVKTTSRVSLPLRVDLIPLATNSGPHFSIEHIILQYSAYNILTHKVAVVLEDRIVRVGYGGYLVGVSRVILAVQARTDQVSNSTPPQGVVSLELRGTLESVRFPIPRCLADGERIRVAVNILTKS